MDIYQPEQWREFFLLVGTGAVTLTGLVFVAMSLNPKVLTNDAVHRYRAIGTLIGLAAVFLRAALALMAGMTHRLLGAEFMAVAGVAGFVYVFGYVRAFMKGSRASIARTIMGAVLYIVELVGAGMLMMGSRNGLYILAVTMVVNCCFMISGAWLLVMGVVKLD